jgi:hypothetical protein
MTTPREIIDEALGRLGQKAEWAEKARTHGMVHCSEVANWAELGRNCGFQAEAVIGPASHAEPVPAAARGKHSHDINWPMHSHNIGEEAADVGAVGNAAPAGRPEPASPYPPSNAQRELLPVLVELRPPLQHHGKPFHFIQSAGIPRMARWTGWKWQLWAPTFSAWIEADPSELGHYAYLGPAEWQPLTAELDRVLNGECANLRAQRDALADENRVLAMVKDYLIAKLTAAEAEADTWRAEVEKLDPGRFAPAKPAFPVNALKHSP